MFKKVFSCIVIASLFVLMSGCGGITTLSALGTVGSAAATKVIEHQAGYGIQSPHTIIERVMPAVVTVIAEIPVSKRKSDAPRFIKNSKEEWFDEPLHRLNFLERRFYKKKTRKT